MLQSLTRALTPVLIPNPLTRAFRSRPSGPKIHAQPPIIGCLTGIIRIVLLASFTTPINHLLLRCRWREVAAGRRRGLVVCFAAKEGKSEVGDDTCAKEETEREDLLVGVLRICGQLVES